MIRCNICGKKFKKTKSGKPSAWLIKHFAKDKKHLKAIVPPGLIFETPEELIYWIKIRLQDNTEKTHAALMELYNFNDIYKL